MNYFKAIAVGGLLAASVSSNAALIVELPEFASFDLAGPRSSFKLDSTYSLDPLSSTERVVEHSLVYSFERLTGSDPVGFTRDGRPLRDEAYSDFQFRSDDDINAAFDGIIFGFFPQYDERDISEGLQVGEIYRFAFDTYFGIADFSGCDDPDSRFGCTFNNLSAAGSTILSFSDSSLTASVPVGAPAPLLLAGLAGLWLSRRSTR